MSLVSLEKNAWKKGVQTNFSFVQGLVQLIFLKQLPDEKKDCLNKQKVMCGKKKDSYQQNCNIIQVYERKNVKNFEIILYTRFTAQNEDLKTKKIVS